MGFWDSKGSGRPLSVSGVGTERLGTGRVKFLAEVVIFSKLHAPWLLKFMPCKIVKFLLSKDFLATMIWNDSKMTLFSSEIWYIAFFQLKKGLLKIIFVASFNANRKSWSPVGCSGYQLSLEPLQIEAGVRWA